MKNYNKFLILFAVIGTYFFMGYFKAQAYSPFDQTSGYTNQYLANTTSPNSLLYIRRNADFGQGSTQYMHDFTIFADQIYNGCVGTKTMVAGDVFQSNMHPTDNQDGTFTFTYASTTIPMLSFASVATDIVIGCSSGEIAYNFHAGDKGLYHNNNTFPPSSPYTDTALTVVYNGYNRQNSVRFQTPQYQSGFSSADFKNWWTCVAIWDGDVGGNIGYDVEVDSGTSTSTLTTVDKISDDSFGYLPIYKLPVSECPLGPAKTASSTPGQYYAIAKLFRHSPSGNTQIATSSLITYYITSGKQIDSVKIPNVATSTSAQPDEFRAILAGKFPFAYVYELYDIGYGLSTQTNTSTATLSPLSIIVPHNSTMNNATITISVYDQNTLYSIAPPSFWSTLRTWDGYAMIIGVLFYGFYRLKSLGHNSGGKH